MCLTVPCHVVAVRGGRPTVERMGAVLEVSLLLLDEPVAPGDWLAVQAQSLAVARLEPAEAEELLAALEDLARATGQAEAA